MGGRVKKKIPERSEAALIRAMVKRGYNDQQILAFFTRPTRDLNHRDIGDVRKGKTHKSVKEAPDEELDEFLATWPATDPSTGLSLRGDELLIKAREAMTAAVHTFNSAGLHFRAELFIVTAIIAWTYLLHAYYRREGVDHRYIKNVGGKQEVAKTTSGAEKFWELSNCLKASKCPIEAGAKTNLEFLLELRHEIEHRSTNRIDEAVSAKLQACCINFNEAIKKLFGPQYGLERRLPIALQFVTFSPDQQLAIKKASGLPTHIETMMDAFHQKLTAEQQADPRFAYRVAFVPKIGVKATTADLAIEFFKANSPEAVGLQKLAVREVEKPKYRASHIVKEMRAKGFSKFNMHAHTKLWKALDARNPTKGYGAEILGGEWCWYETWMKRALEHCQENVGMYGAAAPGIA